MTVNDADADAPRYLHPAEPPADLTVRPLPRLGRGVVWSNIVAEMDRDLEERTRDAA
ncbi:DUF6222 family protein [Amycolatopsis sp. NPDC026612]|uniref:DUF6222 family protein n=1 Tax=Amycolatopsis sp. NPDC026612 TaxID=3155466 RepID=UPI0033E58B64